MPLVAASGSALVVPALRDHIRRVISDRPKEQVGWVYAWGHIALVKDVHAERNGAVVQGPTEPMSAVHFRIDAQPAVLLLVPSASP